jgi:hypothetical protein
MLSREEVNKKINELSEQVGIYAALVRLREAYCGVDLAEKQLAFACEEVDQRLAGTWRGR